MSKNIDTPLNLIKSFLSQKHTISLARMKLEGLNILVTGGAGFIGSHLVESLINKGANVTVYDNLSTGKMENLSFVKKSMNFINGDILNYEMLKNSLKKIDIVSHQAAQLEIFLGQSNPFKDLEINTIGTLNVLKAAKEAGVSKVINASSACIYGQTEVKTKEDFLPIPNWEYGVSKLAAERYSTIYNDSLNLPTVNLRYAITYGEREWYRRVLTIFIKRSIEGKPLVVFGKGDQIRDFVNVHDLVDLHNKVIENTEANGESFNVGTGIATSIADLANIVKKVAKNTLNRETEVIFEDTKEGEYSKLVPQKKRNKAELKQMLLDVEKAKDILKWEPRVSLEAGIEKMMKWYNNNQNYWTNIVYTDEN